MNKVILTQGERDKLADLLEGLLNDEGHGICESISTEFGFADFKVEITAHKLFAEEKQT